MAYRLPSRTNDLVAGRHRALLPRGCIYDYFRTPMAQVQRLGRHDAMQPQNIRVSEPVSSPELFLYSWAVGPGDPPPQDTPVWAADVSVQVPPESPVGIRRSIAGGSCEVALGGSPGGGGGGSLLGGWELAHALGVLWRRLDALQRRACHLVDAGLDPLV